MLASPWRVLQNEDRGGSPAWPPPPDIPEFEGSSPAGSIPDAEGGSCDGLSLDGSSLDRLSFDRLSFGSGSVNLAPDRLAAPGRTLRPKSGARAARRSARRSKVYTKNRAVTGRQGAGANTATPFDSI